MKNTVTQDQIDNIIGGSEIDVHSYNNKTTVVICALPNNFVIVESSSCVDPVNYNEKIGYDICMDRIKNKVWELEGYRLQHKLNTEVVE